MPKRTYTTEELRQATKNNYSVAGVMRELGIKPVGGNYETFRRAVKLYNLDISHFTGRGHLRGKTHTYNCRELKDILVKGRFENTGRLKSRLFREGLKAHTCESCGLTQWLGRAISLELHHVDGDRTNHELINLQILCPNCHAQTDNYRYKNSKSKKQSTLATCRN